MNQKDGWRNFFGYKCTCSSGGAQKEQIIALSNELAFKMYVLKMLDVYGECLSNKRQVLAVRCVPSPHSQPKVCALGTYSWMMVLKPNKWLHILGGPHQFTIQKDPHSTMYTLPQPTHTWRLSASFACCRGSGKEQKSSTHSKVGPAKRQGQKDHGCSSRPFLACSPDGVWENIMLAKLEELLKCKSGALFFLLPHVCVGLWF